MLEQSSVELENTISDLEEKNDNVDDEGNCMCINNSNVFMHAFYKYTPLIN